MTAIEIVLLVLGALIFAASFIIPERASRRQEDSARSMGSAISDIDARELVGSMKEDIDRQIRIAVDASAEAAAEDAVLRSERSIEKLTNEKMMAIDEYAQTVMQDINKNHKEVVFLYDMLENKTTDIKNTVRKADSTKQEIEEAGKKVRAELEAIAKRSAETVIAYSENKRVKRPAEPQAMPVQTGIQEEPPVLQKESALTGGRSQGNREDNGAAEGAQIQTPAAPAPRSAGTAGTPAVPEPVHEITPEISAAMKEKGVPKLGRAAAMAFAQAAAMSAEEKEVPEAETNAAQQPVAAQPQPQQQPQPQPQPQPQSQPQYQQQPQYQPQPAPVQEAPARGMSSEELAPNPGIAELFTAPSRGYNVQDDNLHYIDQAAPEPQPQEKQESMFGSNDDLNGLVISMHRKGIDEVEIARRLSIGVGEVRLMIGLYGK